MLGPVHTNPDIFETAHYPGSFGKEPQTTLESGFRYAVLVGGLTGFMWTEAGSFTNICGFKNIRICVVSEI